ncbi:glutamate ABC transporter substrate-binding protein [Nocardioides dongxiaopingii]|uniref:glutamate ABC transporter substrate-binding protein n=1 Tax=Nocardioides sp. S-1144 TaxID=2582905 RepID=UPI00110D5665|nr:glutamate ABC transporter substrate-binding protein [Nocardioides sp. S-1144]QCW51402.1 glutamate ABC transporter substrate-binding protein [Nocardioides sp. S-1144]
MNRRPRLLGALATLAGAVLLAGCGGYDTTTVPEPEAPAAAPPAAAADCTNDGKDELRSYRPTPGVRDSATVREIRDSGKLVAGVAGDTYLLGSRNPETNELEGFDIELVYAIAGEIFGIDRQQVIDDNVVEFRVITASDRIAMLQDGTVDIVARNMTINCARWKQIAFSAEYYRAGQKILVGKGSGITTEEDLAGKRICASAGTTTIDNILTLVPDAEIVTAPDNSRCMVRFQNGDADAVTSDDTVLAGFLAQDPYAELLDTVQLTQEPYGVGVSRDRPDLVRLVNQVLEDWSGGAWQRAYDATLGTADADLGATQPPRAYGR